MSADSILDSIALENFTWSQEEFSLCDFVDRFPLPQIVKVQEGYYGPDEDSCLGADQILFLHTLKHTDKVQARDRKKRELHIPLNCSQKVEIRPSKLKEVFESVSDVAKVFSSKRFPEFVRVTQGYYSIDNDNVCVNPGDKLKLIKVVSEQKNEYLVVESQDGSGVLIHIPLNASAGFQPLSDGREYYIKEAIDMNPLPFFFQFVKPPNLGDTGEASVFNSTLGVLKAEKTYHDSTVICTTKEGNIRTVVTCPKKLQITVTAASGALIGDKEYMKVCKFFHDGVSLTRIENMECFNVFASRDTIREYVYDTPNRSDEENDTPPPVPPKIQGCESGESNDDDDGGGHDDDDDESDHEYTYIPDEDITSWTFQKFDYEEFKSSFDEEEVVKKEQPKQNKENSKEYLEVLPPKYDDAISPEKSEPQLQNLSQTPVKHKIPPPVKPKPVVKVQGTHHIPGSTNDHKQNPESEKEVSIAEAKKSEETDTSVNASKSGNDQKSTSNVTTDIEQMSINEVSEFLKQHRLAEFIEVFEYNQIDGEMLVALDLDMMESLGMNNFQRKKLSKLIQGWRPKF